jgi:hypothetical protein
METPSGGQQASEQVPVQSKGGAKWLEILGNWLENVESIKVGPFFTITFRSKNSETS